MSALAGVPASGRVAHVSSIPAAGALAAVARSVMDGGFPDSALSAARRVLVDTVGCILAGSGEDPVRSLGVSLGGSPDGGPVPLVGVGTRADAATAALVGGTAAVWHDYDSGDRFLGGHPAAHIVPASLALASTARVSGRQVLGALVAGFEVTAMVCRATSLHPTVHPHGTWPTVGVAAAVALLLGMDDDGVASAIEIAGSMGLATTFRTAMAGATVRNLYAGTGAAAGLVAAQAARAGMTGLADAMDDVYGMVLSGGFPAGSVQDAAPECFEIERSYFKGHACARYLHSALDALALALGGNQVDPATIERVEVHTYGFAASMDDPSPRRVLAARFSLPYALAAALVLGDTGIDAFAPPHLEDTAIGSMIAKVAVHEDPLYSAATPAERPARVKVVTSTRTFQAEVRLPHGEPDSEPFSDAQVTEKFSKSARRVLGDAGAARAAEALWTVEGAEDMAEIVARLVPGSHA